MTHSISPATERNLIIPGLSLHPGRQTQAGSNPADVIIYGGAGGGGKSHWLLTEAVRYYRTPGWVAKIFRRNANQIEGGGGLWMKTHELYSQLGGRANNGKLFWTFPSGAHVGFGHLQYEHNIYSHQGKEYAMIGFDELDHFLASQFWYLFTRNRTTCGRRAVIKCTVNPNPEHFCKDLIRWWLDERGQFPDLDKAGQLRWFVRDDDDQLVWHDEDPEHFYEIVRIIRAEEDPDFRPTSLTFIPASVDDNPTMPKSYKAKLRVLPLIERQRLLFGDWLIKPAAGLVFKRRWFFISIRAPQEFRRIVRSWDLASTAAKKTKKGGKSDPDWTVGLLLGQTKDGHFWVLDVKRFRGTPNEVRNTVLATAKADREIYGRRVKITLPQDPGQAGKDQADQYTTLLAGFPVSFIRPTGDKVTRAGGASAQAEQGHLHLVEGPWNEVFLSELEAFPDVAHDDQVDALSDALNTLTGEPVNSFGR